MRAYASSGRKFITECQQNQIGEKLKEGYKTAFGSKPNKREVASWTNSLRLLGFALAGAGLGNVGVLAEYKLQFTGKRLDCIICGYNDAGSPTAVIIELKQWETCKTADGPLEVIAFVAGGEKELLHPCEQVRRYASILQNSHEEFQGDEGSRVELCACAYLHNYLNAANDPIRAEKFSSLIEEIPLFGADDVNEFISFLKRHVGQGDGTSVMSRVERTSYRPSKKLMAHVSEVISGVPEFVLLDEQQVAFDSVFTALSRGIHSRKKQAVIIRGGPGTGKSVLAINLLEALLRRESTAHYVTGSKAFTETLRKIIGTMGSQLFTYSNSYMQALHDSVDVLIVDEAHRIRDVSSDRFTKAEKKSGLKQVEELIRACRVAVFLIDDDQVVRPDEIGSAAYLRAYAEKAGAHVIEYELEGQYRCAGSENYLNWLSSVLGMQNDLDVEFTDKTFEFKIFPSPTELSNAIRQKAADGYSARMMAGFCWPWSDPKKDGQLVSDVCVDGFAAPWNAKSDKGRVAKGIPKSNLWAYKPEGIDQVGCVYTAQGFEFDFAGVIIGEDLRWDDEAKAWYGDKTKSCDAVVKRSREGLVQYLKNTYRVLLSRGMKGCYVYFVDKATEQYVQGRMNPRTQGNDSI